MKNKAYILLVYLAILGVACQKEVTEISPVGVLSANLAFSSAQKIENSVIGVYNDLQDGNPNGVVVNPNAGASNFLSGRALIYVDLMGEDVFDKGSFFGGLPNFSQLANSGIATAIWTAGYASIADANRVSAGIAANASLLSGSKAKEFTAECLFIRAVSQFYLVNFFAQPYNFTADASHPGIPIMTESFSNNDPAANKPRATVAAVYNSIIADLNTALTDLPASYPTLYATKTRATKATAAALLARVYLYKGDYDNAKKVSLSIITGSYGSFALRPTPNGAFGPGNYQTSETIWSIPNNVNDNPNTNAALPQHYMPTGRGDLAVSSSFRNASTNPYFAADDKRRTTMLINGPAPNAAFFYTNKYPDVATRADWSPVFRYAEVLLTYAEATARVSATVDADAVDKLNMVRDRSRVSAPQYTVLSFASKDALIAAILGERRIELAFEGHRFWDLMRTKSPVANKYDADGISLLPVQVYGSNKNIFPIPQAEVDKSVGVLTQNPGY